MESTLTSTLETIPNLLRSSTHVIPLFALQAAAVLGMVGASLVVTRRDGRPVANRGLFLGLFAGIVNYIIAWFVSAVVQGPVRLNFNIDVLILSGLIGGVRGGLACFALSTIARYEFTGIASLEPVIEYAIDVAAGVLLRRLLYAQLVSRYSLRLVAIVWATRIVVTYVIFATGGLAFHGTPTPPALIAVLRFLALPFSLFLQGFALLMIYLDAQVDVQRDREHQLTYTDALTGLPNRQALSEYLAERSTSAPSRSACLAVLEVSNLREFLLRYGPQEGGRLWARTVTPGASSSIPILEPIAHYQPRIFQYGDFSIAIPIEGVTLPYLEKSSEIEAFIEHMAKSVATAWPGFAPAIRCAVVDLREGSPEPPASLPYRNITLALNSLEAGVAYFNDIVQRDSALDDYIEESLGKWLLTGDVPLHYQPKILLEDMSVIGAEGLLRMTDPAGEPVAPMRAISLFRRKGLLVDFEWSTLRTAVRFIKKVSERRANITIAVNVSAESLQSVGFALRVRALLAEEGVLGRSLRLEIVEWSEMAQLSSVEDNLRELTTDGVSFSLDDFGVGYSTLLLLTQIAFSEVKIEQSVIWSLDGVRSQSMVAFIVRLAHQCGALVVAEGTRSAYDEETVRNLGVDIAQGFLYSHAIPAEEFLSFQPNLDRSALIMAS
jgi:diguanylate cyclase